MSRRRRRASLVEAAVRLARLLGPDDCVLVGGLAVGVHGYVRATDDLDFVCRRPLADAREALRKADIETRVLRGDPLEGGFSRLKGEVDGIPFDVLPPLVPVAWDRAVSLDIRGGRLNVVDLDSLFQLKFRAGGPQDLMDAARLVLCHPEAEARARELATAYRVRDRIDTWLRDPRIRAQAREEAAREGSRADRTRGASGRAAADARIRRRCPAQRSP